MNYIAVLITFGLILFADKYRYRPPITLSTRRLSKRSGTVEPVVIERANPGILNYLFLIHRLFL
jgi:hypothetical protein